jgi:hypothetical protein
VWSQRIKLRPKAEVARKQIRLHKKNSFAAGAIGRGMGGLGR